MHKKVSNSRMATLSQARQNLTQLTKNQHQNASIVEEINGLIKVYKNGHVERPQIVPNVSSTVPVELKVIARDVVINNSTNLWARIYAPTTTTGPLPVLVYFHGGGFCVGSAAWRCYHDFLATLSSKANCVIISVNYRLAPEHRLPCAYEDGSNALAWIKHVSTSSPNDQRWWLSRCNFSNLYISGDSAGANIAYHVVHGLNEPVRGAILIQPFFGGEGRTTSERMDNSSMYANSILSLSDSDAYWRLALPVEANRDHPWSNPIARGAPSGIKLPRTLVCVSELDILRDRDSEFCDAMIGRGIRVEKVIYRGVGHGFQVLCYSSLARARTEELMARIKSFIHQ